jgi:hypothetical protein
VTGLELKLTRAVILSGVAASLREAATQSKDPYLLHVRCRQQSFNAGDYQDATGPSTSLGTTRSSATANGPSMICAELLIQFEATA